MEIVPMADTVDGTALTKTELENVFRGIVAPRVNVSGFLHVSIVMPFLSAVLRVKPVTGFWDGGALTPATCIETTVFG